MIIMPVVFVQRDSEAEKNLNISIKGLGQIENLNFQSGRRA